MNVSPLLAEAGFHQKARITLPLSPRSVQHGARARVVRGRFCGMHNDADKAAYIDQIIHEAGHQKPAEPLSGILFLSVSFYLERPKWAAEPGEPEAWGFAGPDYDNLAKGAQDALSKCGFWHNDGQIAGALVWKRWADAPLFPRIEAAIYEKRPGLLNMPPALKRINSERLLGPSGHIMPPGEAPVRTGANASKRNHKH